MNHLLQPRISKLHLDQLYFWTATINNWHKLLLEDTNKQVILSSFYYLSNLELVDIFAFVIMPNHVHLIWKLNKMNGKEMPHASFLKFTSHEFKKKLLKENPKLLDKFKINKSNKNYEFWQLDPWAITLYTPNFIHQKMNYIHYNPVAKHWALAKDFVSYKYSSASFYEKGNNEFDFIRDIRNLM